MEIVCLLNEGKKLHRELKITLLTIQIPPLRVNLTKAFREMNKYEFQILLMKVKDGSVRVENLLKSLMYSLLS